MNWLKKSLPSDLKECFQLNRLKIITICISMLFNHPFDFSVFTLKTMFLLKNWYVIIKYNWLNLRHGYLPLICLVVVTSWSGSGVRNPSVTCWLLLLLARYTTGAVAGSYDTRFLWNGPRWLYFIQTPMEKERKTQQPMRPTMRINLLPACFLTWCLNSAGPRTVTLFPTLIYSKENMYHICVWRSLFRMDIMQSIITILYLKRSFRYVQLWSIQLSLQTNCDC